MTTSQIITEIDCFLEEAGIHQRVFHAMKTIDRQIEETERFLRDNGCIQQTVKIVTFGKPISLEELPRSVTIEELLEGIVPSPPPLSVPPEVKLIQTMRIDEPDPIQPACNDTLQSAGAYLHHALNCPELHALEDYIRQHSDVPGFSIYQKKIIKFRNVLEGTVSSLQNHSYDFSKTAVNAMCKAAENELLDNIADAVRNRILDGRDAPEHWKLLEYMTAYLKACGFCTYNHADVGQKITSEDYDYYESGDAMFTKNASLHNVIMQINRLPYLIRFRTEDGCIRLRAVIGSITTYE